jgi:hypothetical protein
LAEFQPEWIRTENCWTDLKCDITYPLKPEIERQIYLLGTVEADIPLELIFPQGQRGLRKNAHFKFIPTVSDRDQEIKFNISYVDGESLA